MTDNQTRCGIVALVGAPNAGKSTLTNALVGEKISIVTHKVQTTRTRVLGIALHENTQIILLDTPGIFNAKEKLEKAMVDAAFTAADEADVRVLMIDASEKLDKDILYQYLDKLKTPLFVALNKVDITKPQEILEKAALLNHPRVEMVYMISALTQDGVADLKRDLAAKLPISPWLYPEDDLTDMPQRMLAAEITREKLILQLRQELPYDTYVETEKFEDFDNGDVKISQMIVVDRDSQKSIVVGHKGERIKKIREAAQKELSELFGRKVHLFLFVKVIKGWKEKPDFYRLVGLEGKK